MKKSNIFLIALFAALILSAPVCFAEPTDAQSGTVRVNNLANLEALLNIFANLGEIFGLAIGFKVFPCGIVLLFLPGRRVLGIFFALGGLTIAVFGIAMPGLINWLVASARDANMFN